MAITKLISPSTPNPLPPAGAGGDWDKAMAQLTAVKKLLSGEQMILTQWTNSTTAPALAKGSYLQHLGAIYVVDTEDYALPALSADGTYYIKLTISGETLVPTYITSLAGFSWSAQHNGLYNASDEQILPYSVIREGSSYGKRKILNLASSPNLLARVDYQGNLYGNAISGASLAVTGNITVGGTVDGHDIDSELDTLNSRVNQGVKTTDTPTFASINTGHGYNEVYRNTYVNYGTGILTSVTMDAMEIGELRFVLIGFGASSADKDLIAPSTGSYIRFGSTTVYSGGSILASANYGAVTAFSLLIRRIS